MLVHPIQHKLSSSEIKDSRDLRHLHFSREGNQSLPETKEI
jgi:hypothetical protein